MIDTDKLKAVIEKSNLTNEEIAKELAIDASTFYRRLNGGGELFRVREVRKLKRILGLKDKEAIEIFFKE